MENKVEQLCKQRTKVKYGICPPYAEVWSGTVKDIKLHIRKKKWGNSELTWKEILDKKEILYAKKGRYKNCRKCGEKLGKKKSNKEYYDGYCSYCFIHPAVRIEVQERMLDGLLLVSFMFFLFMLLLL